MKQIPFYHTELIGGFWGEKQRITKEVTLDALYRRYTEDRRLEALQCNLEKQQTEGWKSHIYWDYDAAKWIEGLSFQLEHGRDAELEAKADGLIDTICENQLENGYFNCYFNIYETDKRFQDRDAHELFCLGHYIEAATAYYHATGKDKLLRFVQRYTDLVIRVFTEEHSSAFDTPGHEEIELALVKLYRTTGNRKYLDLAKYFIDNRGRSEKDGVSGIAALSRQDHLPVREQTTAEGHAVRALYLYSAMADIGLETGDASLLHACEAIFRNISEKRMFITGSVGSSCMGECFTVDFDLRNENAYAESCAAIAMAFFTQRMTAWKPDSRFADAAERVMYNGGISGISLKGDAFFYENPLSFDLLHRKRNQVLQSGERYPITQRVKMFSCNCCPPNILRFINSIAGYQYTEDGDTLYVHQYMNGVTRFDGNTVRQITEYPSCGKVRLELDSRYKKIAVRVPAWCRTFTASAEYTMTDGYAYFDAQPVLELDFHIRPRLVVSAPGVHDNAGKAALMYGPVVYCVEGIDNAGDIFGLSVASHPAFDVTREPDFPLPVITADGYAKVYDGRLYPDADSVQYESGKIRFIPYFAMENRGETDMQVWLPVR